MEHERKEKMAFTESAKVDSIKKFFMEFKDKNENYKYIDKIDGLSGTNLMVDRLDLLYHERKSEIDFPIWEFFMNQTNEAIRLCKRAVREVYATRHGFDHSHDIPG